MGQDDYLCIHKEGQDTEGITTNLDPNFPKILAIDELLAILSGYGFKFLYQTKYPEDLLGLFPGQGVEEVLDRTIPRRAMVENELAHRVRLT